MTFRVYDRHKSYLGDLPKSPETDHKRLDGGKRGRQGNLYRPVSRWLAISPRVSVVIPAKNEAKNLPHVFATLPGWVDEIVLVDGRSVDGTASVARQIRPDVKIVSQEGQGKGDALLAGFAVCTGDIIVTVDADGSADGSELTRFIAALVTGADFAKGSRFAPGGGSDDITLMRRLGNRALKTLVNRAFGARYTDLCYGYNAFWARHLATLALDCPGFEVEALMNVRAAKAGLTVQEVPSREHPRIQGDSHLRAVRDGWRILRVIVREWRSPRGVRAPEALPHGTPASSPVHAVAVLAAETDREQPE